jgi:hypothetical protein
LLSHCLWLNTNGGLLEDTVCRQHVGPWESTPLHMPPRSYGSSNSCRSRRTTISPVGTSCSKRHFVTGPLDPWSFLMSATRISVRPKKSERRTNRPAQRGPLVPNAHTCHTGNIELSALPPSRISDNFFQSSLVNVSSYFIIKKK